MFTFAEMATLYQAADAYVMPYHAEWFSKPVPEAVACGLPAICTQGGPTDDFTSPEFAFPIRSNPQMANPSPSKRGTLLVPDEDHLIEQMTALIEKPETVAIARAAGPAYVSSQFTWIHVVGRLLDLLFPNNG
jgi:glycosyltransferase involved in cell wall biosynthesis